MVALHVGVVIHDILTTDYRIAGLFSEWRIFILGLFVTTFIFVIGGRPKITRLFSLVS